MLILALLTAAQSTCVVPPALAGFTSPVAMRADAKLRAGQAMRVPLAPDARLAVAPGRAPAVGTHGGVSRLPIARAGRYRIVLDGPAWIEVARDGRKLASVAHGHAPPCSGARKMVDFDLTAGDHVVQLSGSAAPAATVLVQGR